MSKKENALVGDLALSNLRNSKIILHEDTEGLFIPFRKKGLKKVKTKKGKIMALLSTFCLPLEDNYYGYDYMVSRARAKDESDNSSYTEILGNLTELQKGKKINKPKGNQDKTEERIDKDSTPDEEMGKHSPF